MQFQYGQHGGSWKKVRSCRVDPGDGGAGLFFKIYCKQQQQQEQTVTSMHSVCEQNDLNEKFGLIIDSSLRLACHLWLIFGSLSTDDGNVTENGKKATGLDWQSNNFARASHFFCTFFFFALIARLRRENAYFHVLCGRCEHKKRLSFSFPELRVSLSEFNSGEKLPTFADKLKEME